MGIEAVNESSIEAIYEVAQAVAEETKYLAPEASASAVKRVVRDTFNIQDERLLLQVELAVVPDLSRAVMIHESESPLNRGRINGGY